MTLILKLTSFQDSWDLKIDLVSPGTNSQVPFTVIHATGCSPLDGIGGDIGWEGVKTAFSRSNPTASQEERKALARVISPLGHEFDPSKPPSLEALNEEGEFAKHCR